MQGVYGQIEQFLVAAACLLVAVACLYLALGLWLMAFERALKVVGFHLAFQEWWMERYIRNDKARWVRLLTWYSRTFRGGQ